METLKKDATECVGKFEMRVEFGRPTGEASERWNQRIEALTAWLLAEWRREYGETA